MLRRASSSHGARCARRRAEAPKATKAGRMTRRMMTRRIATRAVGNEGGDVAESTDAVLFAYDAVVDATVEMTRISHAVAAARWPENVPGDASSYVEAMRAMRRCIGESTSCEGVLMVRVIADEAIIGGRTTSGGRPGPVFSAEQRFERRTRPLTVDEIVSSWTEIKLMSVLKWGEKVESSVGWDGRRMLPLGLQEAVDRERVRDRDVVEGEQVVYEDLKPLLKAAIERGTRVFVMTSPGRTVEHCRDVLRENGFDVAEKEDDVGVSVVPIDGFASRSLAAANLIATTARPGEHWNIIDGDMDELERYKMADLGEAYESLTEGVEVTLRHAGYAYASPKAIHRASLDGEIHSLTAESAKHMALNFLGDFAVLMGR